MGLLTGASKGNGYRPSQQNGLPVFSSAVQEKMHIRGYSQSWTRPLAIPIPGAPHRRPLHIPFFNVGRAHQLATARFGRRRGLLVLVSLAAMVGFFIYSATKRISQVGTRIDMGLRDASTLVYEREDLQKIWEWEIASGHYPSNRERACCAILLFVAC